MLTLDSAIQEKINQKTTNNGDHDRYQHYFAKKDIEDLIFNGTPMRALCGVILTRMVDPKGRTVCQTCKDIYEQRPDTPEG